MQILSTLLCQVLVLPHTQHQVGWTLYPSIPLARWSSLRVETKYVHLRCLRASSHLKLPRVHDHTELWKLNFSQTFPPWGSWMGWSPPPLLPLSIARSALHHLNVSSSYVTLPVTYVTLPVSLVELKSWKSLTSLCLNFKKFIFKGLP